MDDPRSLLLFDGHCGLCDRVVSFVLARDRRDRFRFAPLQGELAKTTLARHGRDAPASDTFYVVLRPGGGGERLLAKGRAALFVLRRVGLPWSLATVFGVLPTCVLDFAYDRVARNRMRFFGRRATCRVPSPAERTKFADVVVEETPGA